jgi:hypothetical protein
MVEKIRSITKRQTRKKKGFGRQRWVTQSR